MEYRYKCGDCGYKFSICVPMSNKSPDWDISCPKCYHKGQVKRIWDKFSFVLKGSGFYSTDHTSKTE
jgi:putative FmdB family regulatory protein